MPIEKIPKDCHNKPIITNTLQIAESVFPVESIRIDSRYSGIYVQPQFTLTITVYRPEVDDPPTVISFEHQIIPDLTHIDRFQPGILHFNEQELNQVGNLLYYQDQELRAIELTVDIQHRKSKPFVKGAGKLRHIKTGEILPIQFQAPVEITPTEHIPYRFSIYHFQRGNMTEVLSLLASQNEQQEYKDAVPFVHIPFEALSDWDSAYGVEYKWFYEEYSGLERAQLDRVNEQIEVLWSLYEGKIDEFPDVPEVFENETWQKLMRISAEALILIKK